MQLEICSWIRVITQSVPRSGLCLTTKSGEVAIKGKKKGMEKGIP